MDTQRILDTAPDEIHRLGQAMVEARAKLDQAKLEVAVAEAKATILHSDKKNQAVIRAHVVMDGNVGLAELALINARKEYELAELAYQKEENSFISARKMASLDH